METKKCRYCFTDIPFKATKCPNCKSDIRSWLRRHPILSFIIGTFIFGMIVSTSFNSVETVSQSTKVDSQSQVIVFDIPSILDKTITEIENELGEPSWDIGPTDLQVSLGATEWDKNWEKDGETIMVTYYINNGKVKEVFLEANNQVYENRDKNRLLKIGNLNSNNYNIKFVDQINRPGYFTGIIVSKTN